jgi:hypothetical protein
MLLSLFASKLTIAIDNGYGVTPPRGWRSWNQFAALKKVTGRHAANMGSSRSSVRGGGSGGAGSGVVREGYQARSIDVDRAFGSN